MASEHKRSFCYHCEADMFLCGTCGNNTCNGGYGTVDGQDCPDCPSAYEQHQKLVQEAELDASGQAPA